MWSDQAAAIRRLGSRWLGAFERVVDPYDLRHRVAGVLLSLATGPHRVQELGWQVATARRLDLVERWLDMSVVVTAVSPGPHLAD